MSTIRVQALPKFPASVEAGDGITITRTNGTYVFSIDAGIVQPADADLTALANNSTNGLWARTGAGTGAARTLTGTANEITVTNGDGVSGSPTLSLPAALTFAGKTIAGGTYSSPTLATPTATTSLAIGGAAIPKLKYSPSSGATKNFSLFQNGDVTVFSDDGVANRATLDLATGTFSLLTGGLVVNPGGTTASLTPPGLSPTQFIGTGVNPALNFRLADSPGIGGAALYLHWNQYDSAGTENRVASIGPGLTTNGTTAGALNASIDIALRVNNNLRGLAIAGIEGSNRAGIIPDAGTTWVLGQAGQGYTTVRVENSFSSAIAPALEFRDTAVGVTAGGLWRAANTGGGLYFQKNTSAGGSFSTSTNFFHLDSAAATTVFDAAVNFNSAVLQQSTAGADFGNYRNSASPAANDFLGRFTLFGNNSSAAPLAYAQITAQILDATASSEDAILMLRTVVAGSLADRLTIGQGAKIGSPTGGDKGTGTLNAVTLYQNGTALAAVATSGSAADLSTGTLPAGRMPALTGDITTSAGGAATTLATVNSNVGTFGSATQASQVTVNGKGLVTAAANVTVTPAVGSVTGLGTGVATALGTNVGSAGAPVVNGGALGTPSSGTLTNCAGLPSSGVTGTTAGGDAASGILGEYQTNNLAFASRISLSSGAPATVITVGPLGAGDWEVSGTVLYELDTTTTLTRISACIGTAPDTFDGASGVYNEFYYPSGTVLGAAFPAFSTPVVRKNSSGSATYHLIARASYGGPFCKAYGMIRARRIR